MAVRRGNRIDDGGEVRSDNWFAKQLGEGWQTSGDGIYTFVSDEPSESSDSEVIEPHLVDHVAPARQPSDDCKSDSVPNAEHSLTS
jgi:hypothetical protein